MGHNKQFLTAMLDKMIVLLMVVFALFALAVANMHKKTEASNPKAPISEQGVLQVTMFWNDASCADVDLWVRAPGDAQAAGFLHRDEDVTNLLRDDLGCVTDKSGRNFEIASTHGLPAGEYIIATHYFDPNNEGTQQVHVIVQARPKKDAPLLDVLDETVVLKEINQEITVARITLDDKGHVVSITHLPISIVDPQAKWMSLQRAQRPHVQ